jgi:6-phosphogluconate dehydrogenase
MAVSDANPSDVGILGLDMMGRNAALHLAELDFNVTACDWGRRKTRALREQTTGPKVRVAANFSELLAKLRHPRTLLIFGGAESPLSQVLDQLLPELTLGDLLMDAGDSFFKDTALHKTRLAERGVQFMGIGLGGGEKGARHGAIVMAGGAIEARERTRPLLEAMAATVRGEPCVSYFETAAAAHFVKLCHAGVEYALLQLLSETFDLAQRTLLLTDEELHDASRAWHLGVLNGYLMEISGRVFEPVDKQTPRLLLEEQLASARNDPQGKWVAQSAWELEVPVPTIEAAVGTQRVAVTERRQALLAAPFRQPMGRFGDDAESVLDELHGALHAAMMITYAQGMALLIAASQHLGFQFNLHEISRAWRGCTHLRTSLLDDITTALQATPDLPGLLADDDLSEVVMARQENLRHAVWRAHELDAVVPALLASLDYLDASREAWLPVNLIQVPPRPPARPAVQTDLAY